mmetsp:Transcript_19721/g.35019  ORF Transcript_19721/g.35019 Transcript_19721/m.35019 type:complete len:785 (-) Transcript_19721:65-2419(-)
MASAAPSSNGAGQELTRAQLAAAQQGSLQGPYDLAWLLERVADFGTEEPTWRPPGQHGPWKPEAPPSPMQVLVPEMVLFDSAGNGLPSALVFTDRGGFLRAIRRPLHKEPGVMFDAMLQLMRHRQSVDTQIVKDLEAVLQASGPMDGLTFRGSARGSNLRLTTASVSMDDGKAEKVKKAKSPERDNSGMSKAGDLKVKTPTAAAQSHRKGWKLTVAAGSTSEKRLSDQEVAPHFGSSSDGRVHHWPKGAKLLQACFWTGMDTAFPGGDRIVNYHYDALETEVPGAVHNGLEAIITNHFERFSFLDGVRNRNRMSAVPYLLAEHLSFYCNLELVSGDFGFINDRKGQIWLVEAKNLLVLPNVNRTGQNAQAASSGEALPQKLFRYLSEEALQNMPVKSVEGEKCERMMRMMMGHYKEVKDHFQVEKLLRPEHEEMHINIPVLEGTDQQALAKTFGLTGLLGAKKEGTAGDTKFKHRFAAPKKQMPVGRGRWFSSEAAEEAEASQKGKKVNPIIEQGRKAKAAREAELRAKTRSTAAGALTERTPRLAPKMLQVPNKALDEEASSHGRPQSARGDRAVNRPRSSSKRSAGRAVTRNQKQLGEAAPHTKIEIVSTPVAKKLVQGAGTAWCPEGPTLDSWTREGHLSRVPGQGLMLSKKEATPNARAVVVPPDGLHRAMARLSARQKEAEELAAEKLEKLKPKTPSHRKTVTVDTCGHVVAPQHSNSLSSNSINNSFRPGLRTDFGDYGDFGDFTDGDGSMPLKTPRSGNPDGPNGHQSLLGFLAAPI